MLAFAHPESRYAPQPIVDLTDREIRERLSPAALKAFFALVDRWNVRDEDARLLLGGLSNGPYYTWRKAPERTLDTDTLTRVSLLLGIFRALGRTHAETFADGWVKRRNTHPLFGGRTPLEFMIQGGIPAMQNVRQLVESRVQGS